MIAFWATQVLGAISVGLNGWWVPREVEYGLTHSHPTVVIADAKRAETLAAVGTDLPVLTMEADLPAIFAKYAGSPMPHTDVDEDDPAAILYTSGTSGRPKGALHSQRNILAVVDYHRFSDAVVGEFSGRPVDPAMPSPLRYLLTSPLFHIASLHNLVIPRLATGGAVVMHQADSTWTPCSVSSSGNGSPTGERCPRWRPVWSSTTTSTSTTCRRSRRSRWRPHRRR